MKKQKEITAIAVQQTSRVIGILYFVLTALIFIPLGIMAMVKEGISAGWAFLALPLIYGFAFYLISLVACWIYNKMTPHIGGIAFTLDDESAQDS